MKANVLHNHLKYIIIGDVGVGKSCILLRFTENSFQANHKLLGTRRIESGRKVVIIDGKEVNFQLWEVSSQESKFQLEQSTPSYYRGADGVMLVYDITRRGTFEHCEDLSNILSETKENYHSEIIITLIGNKSDLDNKRVVSYEEGKQFADEHGFAFIETSATVADNVEAAFIESAEEIYENIHYFTGRPSFDSM
mmetsp:Transcript_23580/g.36370  ORF Transcript_23580/g.36370 Transcript_23580/m.36370 type:complete len:195 (-) Transcript_23580:158-742(-)